MEVKRYRFKSAFEAVIASSQPKKPWYDVDCSGVCKAESIYVVSSIVFFVSMAIFGGLAIRLYDACQVQNPDGACCHCCEFSKAQLVGQEEPMMAGCRNAIYYGVCVLVCVLFGMYYVWQGVRNENKYLLFVIVVTQVLMACRGVFDILRAHRHEEPEDIQFIREIALSVSGVFLVVSIASIKPVYKKFGWRIFRRGGAKRQVREYYKSFQRFRALNHLDVQSSTILFLLIFFYLDINLWVLIVFAVCDILSSRYEVKYLKRECLHGVVLSCAAKLFLVGVWCVVVSSYVSCYSTYADSRARSGPWLAWTRLPNLQSVHDTYDGLHCLSDHTVHDARTFVTIIAVFIQAILSRMGALVFSIIVCRNFGMGLKEVFYGPGDHEEKEERLHQGGSHLEDHNDAASDDASELHSGIGLQQP